MGGTTGLTGYNFLIKTDYYPICAIPATFCAYIHHIYDCLEWRPGKAGRLSVGWLPIVGSIVRGNCPVVFCLMGWIICYVRAWVGTHSFVFTRLLTPRLLFDLLLLPTTLYSLPSDLYLFYLYHLTHTCLVATALDFSSRVGINQLHHMFRLIAWREGGITWFSRAGRLIVSWTAEQGGQTAAINWCGWIHWTFFSSCLYSLYPLLFIREGYFSGCLLGRAIL